MRGEARGEGIFTDPLRRLRGDQSRQTQPAGGKEAATALTSPAARRRSTSPRRNEISFGREAFVRLKRRVKLLVLITSREARKIEL